MTDETEYLTFTHEKSKTGKTIVLQVHSTKRGMHLATIKWFGRWRRYGFFPDPDTVWDPACLRIVLERIEALNRTRLRRP